MIVIVDYKMGNVGSITNILRKVGAEATISSDRAVIAAASKLILPGVGAFDEGVRNIEQLGLRDILTRRVQEDLAPTLGICLGMQLMTRRSEEGERDGLHWIDADVKRFRFPAGGSQLKVPHMGWNTIKPVRDNPLFSRFAQPPRFYFVHSYHVVCDRSDDVLATASHGYEFVAAFRRGNLIGVQFHPEKSHRFGMTLFRNFVECC